MDMKLDKKALHAELMERLAETLRALVEAHGATIAGATHEEAKPENDKDTRALEQQYLARGQAMRVEALKAGVSAASTMSLAPVDSARVGAVIEAEDDEGQTVRFFIAPEGGGLKLKSGAQVLTPNSPLGAAMIGKREGDEFEVKMGPRSRTLTVLSIQ